MERVAGRQEKIEGHCSTGQSPQWAVVPMEEEEEEEEERRNNNNNNNNNWWPNVMCCLNSSVR